MHTVVARLARAPIPEPVPIIVYDIILIGAVRKVTQRIQPDGSTTNLYTGEPFNSGLDLAVDLDFFHDYQGEKRLYLCSTEGNPTERFSSIELLVNGTVVKAVDNVHIDNLCVMYGGSHGIGSSTTQGLTVTNCVIGWIGGSILSPAPKTGGRPSRFGNGVLKM